MDGVPKCQCGGPLPVALGENMVRCAVCAVTPFCVWCSIRDDDQLLICNACDEEQTLAARKHQEEFERLPPCDSCGDRKREQRQCKECARKLCIDICTPDPARHACVQCWSCKHFATGEFACCGKRYCSACCKLHRKTNCVIYTARTCQKCRRKILCFSHGTDRTYRCIAREDCNKWPCYQCDQVASPCSGLACVAHRSSALCPGCHLTYALDGRQGKVRILYRWPGRVMKHDYCGRCYRAHVLPFCVALWRFAQAQALKPPPQLLEAMILERLRALSYWGK